MEVKKVPKSAFKLGCSKCGSREIGVYGSVHKRRYYLYFRCMGCSLVVKIRVNKHDFVPRYKDKEVDEHGAIQ